MTTHMKKSKAAAKPAVAPKHKLGPSFAHLVSKPKPSARKRIAPRCDYSVQGTRCRKLKGHAGDHSARVKRAIRRAAKLQSATPVEKSTALVRIIADSHALIDKAIATGRKFLYVDNAGHIRDFRHDAEAAGWPSKPIAPTTPAESQACKVADGSCAPTPSLANTLMHLEVLAASLRKQLGIPAAS